MVNQKNLVSIEDEGKLLSTREIGLQHRSLAQHSWQNSSGSLDRIDKDRNTDLSNDSQVK